VITDLNKCNFREIAEYYKVKAEERKNMTKEEKQVGFCYQNFLSENVVMVSLLDSYKFNFLCNKSTCSSLLIIICLFITPAVRSMYIYRKGRYIVDQVP